MTGLVIVMILIIISYSYHKNSLLVIKATNLLGKPTWITPEAIIWTMSKFKLTIADNTKLPVQLYFTWDTNIVRPRNELYQILSRVCTDSINYDVSSSKFTVKDVSLEGVFAEMEALTCQVAEAQHRSLTC